MSKIIKYTFELPELVVENGELVENGTTNETYTFTLLHRGTGIFEELSGKPLMSFLMDLNVADLNKADDFTLSEKKELLEKMTNKNFIGNLACASYVKIEDNKFHNNRATAEEFKKTNAYQKCVDDFDFIQALLGMAVECLNEQNKSEAKTKSKVKQTKK